MNKVFHQRLRNVLKQFPLTGVDTKNLFKSVLGLNVKKKILKKKNTKTENRKEFRIWEHKAFL